MLIIKKNEATAGLRRMYFHCVDATDGMTPETGEAGGQPQVSVNGDAFGTQEIIGVLVAIGNGRYYAELTQAGVDIADRSIIEGRYKSANTAEAIGTTIQILEKVPLDAVTDIATLDAKVVIVDTVVDAVKTETDKITAVKAKTDIITSDPATATIQGQIKAKTDLIPTSPATEGNVTAVGNAVTAVYNIVAHATYGLSAIKTLIDGLASAIWTYATRTLSSRNITTGENIARQETMTSSVSNGVLQNAMTVSDEETQEIVRGDVKTFTFNLGTTWDLTGKKVYFMAKSKKSDTDANALFDKTCTITDASNGVCTTSLTATNTATAGKYFAEVEVRNTDESNPQTALQFVLQINDDIRKGT